MGKKKRRELVRHDDTVGSTFLAETKELRSTIVSFAKSKEWGGGRTSWGGREGRGEAN